MPFAKDEAGNVWEVDANGNPIRVVQQAQTPRPVTVGTPKAPPPTQPYDVQIRGNEARASEYEADRAAADVRASNASANKTSVDAQGSALDNQVTAATMPNVINKSYWDATAAERAAMTAGLPAGMMWISGSDGKPVPAPIPNMPKDNKGPSDKALAAQETLRLIDGPGGLQQQYNENYAGRRNPFEYLYFDANDRFNAGSAALLPSVKKLQRTPGEGAQSDRDAAAYEAMLPNAYNRDPRNLENLNNLRQMALATLEAEGIAPPDYVDKSLVNKDNVRRQATVSDNKGQLLKFSAKKQGITPEALEDINTINAMIASGASYEELVEWAATGAKAIPTSGEEGEYNKSVWRNQIKKRDQGKTIKPLRLSSPSGFSESEGSALEKLRARFLNSSIGAGALNMADAGSLGLLQAISPTADLALDVTRENNPYASLAGSVLGGFTGGGVVNKGGGLIGSQIAKRAPKASGMFGGLAARSPKATQYAKVMGEGAAYGGIYGANSGEGATEGALYGALGGGLGQGVTSGLGRVTRGISDASVQELNKRGIPLTLGQILGNRGPAGRTMNKLESIPVLGDMIASRRGEGVQRFNIEAMKDAVAPVGGKIDVNDLTGALGQAQNAVAKGYDDALSGVNVRADSQLGNEYAQLAQRLNDEIMPYSPETGGVVQSVLRDDLAPLFGKTGELDGGRMQQAFQTLQKARAGLSNDYFGGKAKDVLSDTTTSLEGLMQRQAPDAFEGYQSANKAFRNLKPIEQVMASRVEGGVQNAFTPTQLAQAVTANTKKFGGLGAAARGDNKTPLMRAAEEVLPPTIPNSGSADRGFMGLVLPAALGGGAIGTETLTDNRPLAAALATLAALTSKKGGAVTQKALVDRPESLRRLGGLIEQQSGRVGMFGGRLLPVLSTF